MNESVLGDKRSAWLALPTWEGVRVFMVLFLLLCIQFVFIYGGANWVGSMRSDVHSLFAEFELGFPFVPEMIFVYMSLNLLTALSLFTLTVQEMRSYAWGLSKAMLLAGAVFFVFPTKLGYVREVPEGWLGRLYQGLFGVDLPHNMFPSLHVTFSSYSGLWIAQRAPLWFRVGVLIWVGMICVSVILVRQHHLADIGGGLALAAYLWSRR